MGKSDQIRRLIAKEAARLMYEEGVREYRDAKRKAAHRFGPAKGLSLGDHLPSNAEIHQELQHLIRFYEKEEHPERLLKLRLLALKYMNLLKPFRPYLVGSVLSGVITSRSDIDLHLFADTVEEVEDHLKSLKLLFESEMVTVRKGGEFRDYPHIYLEEDEVEIECSIYPPEDIHRIPKSSITGRAMERAGIDKLRKIIAKMMIVQ